MTNSDKTILKVKVKKPKKVKVMLDVQAGIANILSVYNRTPDATKQIALHWYVEANEYASKTASTFGIDTLRVAAVTAALSPNNPWKRNLKDAYAVLQAVNSNLGIDSIKVCTFNKNKIKAFALATVPHLDEFDALAVLNGQKTTNFFLNIYDPSRAGVTVDGHAYNVFLGVYKPLEQSKVPKAHYQPVVEAYTAVAAMFNLNPCELQAIVWLQWRIENGIVKGASNQH